MNMFKIYLAVFFIIVVFHNCSNKKYQKENSSTSLRHYYQNADSLFEVISMDSAAIFLEKAPILPKDSASAYKSLYKGISLANNDNYRKAIPFLLTAKRLSKDLNMLNLQEKSCGYLANSYSNEMALDTAMLEIKEAISIAEERSSKLLASLYFEMARIYYMIDNSSPKAYECVQKSLQISEKNNNAEKVAFFHYKLSTILFAQKKYDSTEIHIKYAQDYYERTGNSKELIYVYNTLGGLYSATNNPEKAIAVMKRAVELSDSLEVDAQNMIYNIGACYTNYSMTDSAIYYYKYFFDYIKTNKSSKIQQRTLGLCFQELSDIYEDRKNYKEALELNNKYLNLRETYYKKNLDQAIFEIDKKYDLEKKDQQMKELNLEMQLMSKNKKQQWTLFIILILSIVIIALAITFNLRSKTLKAKQKQAMYTQRLLRSQMTPHFIMNTISSIQYFISNNNNKQANKYLVKFSRLLQVSLENADDFLVLVQKEVEALQNYLDLQIMRFGEVFSYEINTYSDFEDIFIYIPPMIIQPFVENSIGYGFHGMESGGKLQIDITKKNGYLLCIIDDNGVGLSRKNIVSRDGERKSMSHKITKDRLEIIGRQLNAASGFRLINKSDVSSDSGLRVEIMIPFKKTIV